MSNNDYDIKYVEQQLRKCGRHVVLYDKYDIKYVERRLRHKVCRITATVRKCYRA